MLAARGSEKEFCDPVVSPLIPIPSRWTISQSGRAPLAATGGGAMAFKVGDVVRLKFGGPPLTVSKVFKSPEGREMVQCTWFDKKPKEHRAA